MGNQAINFHTPHLTRVKQHLESTIKKLRAQVEKTMSEGKITGDYSLGFVNGLIFVDHQLNKKIGQPKFYDRTTSVGNLPKPTALNSGDATKDTTTYQVLMDHVLIKSRNFIAAGRGQLGQEKVFESLADLEQSIEQLDEFVQGDRDGRNEQRNEPGANAEPQPTV